MEAQSGRESDLWEALWRKPQAFVWERLGLEFEVALYVRRFAEAELSESMVTLSTLVRQMADSLGLTTPGLRANRWRIDRPEEAAPKRSGSGPVSIAPNSARARLKAVSGGGG